MTGFGVQTQTITAGTTSVITALPPNAVALLLRCPSGNTADVFVGVGGNFANAGDVRVRAGESINFSNELWLVFKAVLGAGINQNDYIRQIVTYAASSQTLYVDVMTWSGV